MTGLQLQSVNSWFLPRWLVVIGDRATMTSIELVTVDFTLSVFSAANPVATAIWELENFLAAGLVGRRQGYNCDLGTRGLVAGPVGRRQGCNCNLGTLDCLVARS